MAVETIFACRGATYGSAIDGVAYARITPRTVHKTDPGIAGTPGPADATVTDRELVVELYGYDYAALLACIGLAAASCVINTYGAAGASEALTASNVVFAESIGAIEIPEKDSGGKIVPYGIRGYVNFGAGETFANVLTAA